MAGKRRPKSIRPLPVHVQLINPTEAAASRVSGSGTHYLLFNDPGDPLTEQMIINYLLSRDEVRLDEYQVFVDRDEESLLVISLHLPSAGRARQVKFVVGIREMLRAFAAPHRRTDAGFIEQALVDFEQLLVNFVYTALKEFEKSAVALAELNFKQRKEPAGATSSANSGIELGDGREEYIVNASNGWPLTRPRFKLHDVVRLRKGSVNREVDSGYLVRVIDLKPNETAPGTVFGDAIAAYRKTRLDDERIAKERPSPTDVETFLSTGEGRKVRERIVKAFARIAPRMFPPSPGRPLARTSAEEAAIIDEVRSDFNRRKAKYVRKGIRKKHRVIYEEMSAGSTYGAERESLSASTIERFMSRKPQK